MGALRDRMEVDLKLGGYSPSTQKIYLLYARQFAKYFMRPPEELGKEEVRAFLLHLIEERSASRETIRQVRSALTFLYHVTLDRPTEVAVIPVMRRHRRLPEVLSGSEVCELLASTTSIKYRMIFMALYASGLRISETCRLTPQDIDSKRMVIRVRAGKGGKDRYTVLSPRLLAQLRRYFAQYQPERWLFEGGKKLGHASPDTARYVFKKALAATHITKKVTPHVLRHSFATHLLQCGVDVTVVQALLGHGSIRATEVYSHIAVEHIARTQSPLDILGTADAWMLG